jgi:inosine-uridine nucleoside N-ribohydrolase
LLLRREPAVAENIARLVIMGGAVGEGNITPSAEFNVFVYPEAAASAFLTCCSRAFGPTPREVSDPSPTVTA